MSAVSKGSFADACEHECVCVFSGTEAVELKIMFLISKPADSLSVNETGQVSVNLCWCGTFSSHNSAVVLTEPF